MKTNFNEILNREGTACVKYDLRKMFFEREDVMPLWVADMDFRTPPFILDAIAKRLQHPILGYTFREPAFASSLTRWLKTRHQYHIQDNWVCFSPGIVSALVLLIESYTKKGDGILIQTPVYHPFMHVPEHLERKVLTNKLVLHGNQYVIDFDDFEEKAKDSRLFILCNPHNPVGRAWTAAEMEQMAQICQKYGVLMVSDEIHSDLMLADYKHIPLAMAAPWYADEVISCYAPSKTFNIAGLSTSAVVIGNDSKRRIYEATLERLHMGMGNLFGGIAFESAYTNGAQWLSELLEYLNETVHLVKERISTRLPILKLIEPQATYMFWVDFRQCGMSDNELRDFLINAAGVGFNDGFMFGPGGEGFQRINFACPQQLVLEAFDKVEVALKKKGIV